VKNDRKKFLQTPGLSAPELARLGKDRKKKVYLSCLMWDSEASRYPGGAKNPLLVAV